MTKYFLQDGADFYEDVRGGIDHLVHIVTYPHKVRDCDWQAAREARAWFMREYPEYEESAA